MIRNKYRLNNNSLYHILMKSRLNRGNQFEAMISARDANINWLKRVHMNNKHTMGSEV